MTKKKTDKENNQPRQLSNLRKPNWSTIALITREQAINRLKPALATLINNCKFYLEPDLWDAIHSLAGHKKPLKTIGLTRKNISGESYFGIRNRTIYNNFLDKTFNINSYEIAYKRRQELLEQEPYNRDAIYRRYKWVRQEQKRREQVNQELGPYLLANLSVPQAQKPEPIATTSIDAMPILTKKIADNNLNGDEMLALLATKNITIVYPHSYSLPFQSTFFTSRHNQTKIVHNQSLDSEDESEHSINFSN